MSFDLAVWHAESQPTNEEAAAIYLELCENWPYLQGDHPSVAAFYQELTQRWPEIDTVPEDRVGDFDYCPWSCALSHSGMAVVMSCVWPKADEVAAFVRELASRHGLVLFDPQSNCLYLPRHDAPEHSMREKSGWFHRFLGRKT